MKYTSVGMFVMRWLFHTAVWGGHNYAFVADVIVRKRIIIIISTTKTTITIILPAPPCLLAVKQGRMVSVGRGPLGTERGVRSSSGRSHQGTQRRPPES